MTLQSERPYCLIESSPRIIGGNAWHPSIPMTSWQRERMHGPVVDLPLPLLPRIVRRIERALRRAA